MSNDPHAATHDESHPAEFPVDPANGWSESTPAYEGNGDEAAPEEEDYRAAEWHYDAASFYAATDLPTDPVAGEVNGERQVAPHGDGGHGETIAPRPNLRMFGRRPAEGPQDTESKILAVSSQLQELLEQRREEAESSVITNPIHSRRTGFKPSGSMVTGSRLPSAPPISLPVRPHRPIPNTGWPGLGQERSRWLRPVLLTLLGAALLGGVFWAGRASSPPVAASSAMGQMIAAGEGSVDWTPWSVAQIQALDQALALDRNGDVNGALKAVKELMPKGKRLAGLAGYQGNIESRRGNFDDAQTALLTSVDPNNADDQEQVAFFMSRNRDFDKTIGFLTRAITLNPFAASSFSRLGEALRRKGNLADAATRFEEALLRIPLEGEYNEQREQTAFKLRLTEIEGGRKAEVIPELDARIAAGSPSSYWCLTAAAVALQDSNIPAAVTWLTRAKGSLPADQFDALVSDYFFRAYADRPELARFFVSAPAAIARKKASANAYFIDP